jgi:hypothetical protein
MLTELLRKLFQPRYGSITLGMRMPSPISWTRAHQGAREMARRQRQAEHLAYLKRNKEASLAVAEQAAEAL